LLSSAAIGLLPRNAANISPTGGTSLTAEIACCGRPCAARPVRSASGSDEDSPATNSEKNTPIESTMPEFWKVARMPEATPRWSAGTAFMTAVVLGAENRPEPTPLKNSSTANDGYEKFTGISSNPTKVSAMMTRPPVASSLAPYLSDR
jgi:hypothetical protein